MQSGMAVNLPDRGSPSHFGRIAEHEHTLGPANTRDNLRTTTQIYRTMDQVTCALGKARALERKPWRTRATDCSPGKAMKLIISYK